MADSASIQADFDRIAMLPAWGVDHNAHYHRFLLNQLPHRIGEALDLGCGTGDFSRLLAARADRVLGLDLSPGMVSAASTRSAGFANLEFQNADALKWKSPPARFDCVAAIATLHHLPMGEVVARMKQALRPGGSMLILDLYRVETLTDFLTAAAGVPLHLALRLAHTGFAKPPREIRDAWDAHGRTDRYPTIEEVGRICDSMLPGAKVRRHLLWRYSLVWRAPSK